MAGTPRTSLKSLGPRKKTNVFNLNLFHVSLCLFVGLLFIFWAFFFTFNPSGLMSSDDFLTEINKPASGTSDANKKSHKVMSDKGRLAIFLYSLLFSFIATLIYFFWMKYKKY